MPSIDLLRRVVAQFPGAVSYLKVSDLNSKLQVVAVDGKRPGDEGDLLA